MSLQNSSIKVTEFIIDGFDTTKNPLLVGVVILIVYIVAVLIDIVNILVIMYKKKLHKPMYLLICNLAAVDLLYSSSVSPTIIGILVAGVKTISYVPCLLQMFAFHLGQVMEMFALSVMAFDRLIAVSCPFQYHSYLTNARIIVLTYILWIVACAFVAVVPATVIPLPHCYSVLKYNFCSYAAVIRTTCVDPNYYFNLVASIAFFLSFSTFGFICLSYVGIIYFVKLSSNNEKKKIGSTCLSHLIVVTCYYLPLFIIIILTRFGVVLTLEVRNGLNIGTILIPSLVNPFVYCLRTREIKNEIINMFKKLRHLIRF
ncbi:olfactory receptor 51E2-like [Anabas testudineus]|uniref:G-protein coupled receptors family 1 profile domain-containing protein n=1 Tax=Anabas testudineus TaxID=64144 RepID=A0A7N6FLV0_ANATE|nr:olfactory receptor 51E2-like [Anabas testudineus]